MIVEKITKVGKTLWEHKKKTAAGCVAVYFLGRYVQRTRRDARIRSAYCREAAKYGFESISPEDRPRRITALVNVYANERNAFENFKTNALPLLNLAGLEVNVIKAEDEEQMEAIAEAIDSTEADALYIVGGDGTISRVLSGICRSRESGALPIGIFPGGNENRFLTGIAPQVFSMQSDVRRFCESAMALIEQTKREVCVARCELDGFEDNEYYKKPIYGLSDFNAGWFLHMEMRKKKLWYWGALKRRFAYFWEMLKCYPDPLQLSLTYEEYCPGCNRCRPPSTTQTPQWRWWHALVGAPKYNDNGKPKKDYSCIVNENCGKTHQLSVKANDFYVEHLQKDDTSALRLRTGGEHLGRLGVMREGWKRCKADFVATSPDPDFYEHDTKARSLYVSFLAIPDLIRRFTLFGDEIKLEGELKNKKVKLEATNRKIDLYLPSTIRWSLEEINSGNQ
uniref:DAGKc domain-containing protein n=1 Tax=Ascaris lumbricoides TaxID=6252 RepID=A0A9J2PJJ7_ASCLU